MRKIACLLLIVLLMAGATSAQGPEGSPGAEGIGDSFYANLGNGGYDVQHYLLDLTWNDQTDVLSGTATIDAIATQNLSAFNLDFSGFDIEGIIVNGASAEYDRAGNEFIVMPVEVLSEGEAFTVAVTYGGVPQPIGFEFDPEPLGGWVRHENGVFVASEPIGALTWYPVNDHPLDKATYTIRMTVPAAYVVASNGVLEATIEEDDMLTYVWENRHPTASYLVTVNIGDFVRLDEVGPGGLPIRYYFPPDLVEDAVYDFGLSAEVLEYFSEVFGPYPYEASGAVVVDADLGYALETTTMTLYGRGRIDGTRNINTENTIVHELAHEWFGNSVSPADWSDIWLNEGFATYAQVLWAEHAYGQPGHDGMLSWIIGNTTEGTIPIGAPDPYDLFARSIYDRGALTLHALRSRVGDDDFFAIIRTYYDLYQYSTATTADFIAVAEELSGEDLGAFFDAWLYAEEMPSVP